MSYKNCVLEMKLITSSSMSSRGFPGFLAFFVFFFTPTLVGDLLISDLSEALPTLRVSPVPEPTVETVILVASATFRELPPPTKVPASVDVGDIRFVEPDLGLAKPDIPVPLKFRYMV